MKTKILIKEKNESFVTSLKYLLKKIFNRSRYDFRISTNLNLNIESEEKYIKKISSKSLKDKEILLATANGLYILKKAKLIEIFKNKGFYGVAKHKKKYFIACLGDNKNPSEGGIVSFNYSSGKVRSKKIEYKIRDQSLHDIKIWKKKLYVINSTWRKKNFDEILKFAIEENKFELEKKIRIETDYPFNHLNSLFFKKKTILICFHNNTQYTKIPSQVCEFNKNWKFLKILKTDNLSSAHDCYIIDNKLHVLDSGHGIFYMGKKKIHFKNRFVKGFTYDKKKYYVGVNEYAKKKHRNTTSPELVIIDRKNKKKEIIKLHKTGNINNITILK